MGDKISHKTATLIRDTGDVNLNVQNHHSIDFFGTCTTGIICLHLNYHVQKKINISPGSVRNCVLLQRIPMETFANVAHYTFCLKDKEKLYRRL